jgi:outer membrane protein OmpA-like peptidoglycan-associated protein
MAQLANKANDRQGVPQRGVRSGGLASETDDALSADQAVEAVQQHGHSSAGLQRRMALGLLPVMGNSVLQRMLLQRETGDGVATADAPVADDAMDADLAAFLRQGVMPSEDGVDLTPTGLGGFNAKFDPNARELIITMNIGFVFPHGLKIDPATNIVTADGVGLDTTDPDEQGTLGQLQAAATRVMNDFAAADRANEVNSRWRWSGEQDTWMESYRRGVVDAWGGRHFFQSVDWPELFSAVRVNINVHQGVQAGDHCKAKIVKTPPGGGLGAFVQSGTTASATDQELIMSSSAIDPRPDNLLVNNLYFQHDSSDINTANSRPDGTGQAGPAFLNRFILTFNAAPGTSGQKIKLEGHASSSGAADYNQTLSEQRAKAVEDYLKNNGLTGSIDRTVTSGLGETLTEDAESRRVTMTVGDGQPQVVANHETGHLLGLDDEYSTAPGGLISGTGNPIGTAVRHNDIDANSLADAPIDGAVAENNDNIMSLGNTVRPQHYSTFFSALETVTGKNWKYGGEGDPPTVLPGTQTPDGVIT